MAYYNGKKVFSVVAVLGGGLEQPTLFAPIITSGLNTVSWANDTRNGAFPVTLSATVDGVEVTSPLTITEEMDGKTLEVTASATNFEAASTTETLRFLDISSLLFESDNNFTLRTNNNSKNWNGTLEYSTDESTWTTWAGTNTISSANGKLYLRGTNNTHITHANLRQFVFTGSGIRCLGNIENLLDFVAVANGEHPTMDTNCFLGLFNGCTALTVAPALPATTLAVQCYMGMFSGCTALTVAPALPATTLETGCYRAMFMGCTALTTAPALPALEAVSSCYAKMFNGCTALVVLPALPATMVRNSAYGEMFSGCSSLVINSAQSASAPYEFRIPTSGTVTFEYGAVTSMFANTGGDMTSDPSANTTYYTTHEPVAA